MAGGGQFSHGLRIYPYPMVWPLPRPWSETMVSIPLGAQKTLEIKGLLGLERPFLDLVSQTLFANFQWYPFRNDARNIVISYALGV